MPVAGAADRVRGRPEGKGALQPPQEAPWGLVAEQHLPLALQTPLSCGVPPVESWVLGPGRGPAPAPGFHDPLLSPGPARELGRPLAVRRGSCASPSAPCERGARI